MNFECSLPQISVLHNELHIVVINFGDLHRWRIGERHSGANRSLARTLDSISVSWRDRALWSLPLLADTKQIENNVFA